MRQFIFPLKDASIYEEFANRNTGLDEIIEVGKSETGFYRIRSLIGFEIPASVPPNAEFTLQLYTANVEKLQRNQVVRALLLTGSWDEGDGYFYQDRIQDLSGATWNDAASGSIWDVTGSILTGQQVSASFNPTNDAKDFSLVVTSLIRAAISESVAPTLVIALDDVAELDTRNKANIKFFSKDTHTIYRPALVAQWDDSTQFTGTGSLPVVTGSLIHVQAYNLKPTYRVGEFPTIRLIVRPKYPLKTFDTFFTQYTGQFVLPQSPAFAEFSIIDDFSGTVIIPFNEYSRISSDSEGNFFRFKVENMYPNRHYRVLIRVTDENGSTQIFDHNQTFRVDD